MRKVGLKDRGSFPTCKMQSEKANKLDTIEKKPSAMGTTEKGDPKAKKPEREREKPGPG